MSAGDRRTRRRCLRLAWCLLQFVAAAALASDLSVDKRTLTLDDTLTITVSLTDDFAGVDAVQVPVQNLVIEGTPSVSSEFQWINGQSTRRKVFRYTAHPRGPGPALVGPVTLRGSGGQVETLAPVSIQVLPDQTAGSNDPVKVLHELLATGRDPIFLIAEPDTTEAFAGQELVVTWTLYNATNVQQYAFGDLPRLADFWTEELDTRGEQPQQIAMSGRILQKLVIRRAALFSLRSGTLQIEPMSVNAQIMKRVNAGDPFGLFEGVEVDVHRRSAPIAINVRPIPPGLQVAAVGDVALRCGMPVQRNGGPVAIDVSMTGRANLRGAPPPQWAKPIDGSMQIVDAAVSVARGRDDATMTHRWRYLIFPAASGPFVLPPLATTILTPAGTRQELRCEQRALIVQAADASPAPAASSSKQQARVAALRRAMPVMAIAIALLVSAAIAVPPIQRGRRLRRQLRELVKPTAAETRTAVDDWLVAAGIDPFALLRETSDRGDAYRAFRSLIDGMDRDRMAAGPAEVRARVREVIAHR